MGVRRIGRWKITAAVALLLGSFPWGGMAGGLGTELTSATAVSATNAPPFVPLKRSTPYHFSKYKGNQAELLELNVDGIYRLLGRRHDFVKEIDRGTWKPGPTLGEVIMISAGYFESVQAGVLSVDIVSTSTLDNLTSVSLALADVLTSVAATGGVVTVRDYMMMMRMHPAHIGREPQVDGKRAYGPKEQAILKSDEIEAFAAAVKTTLAAPTPTSETLTLRIYKEVTYLDVPASI